MLSASDLFTFGTNKAKEVKLFIREKSMELAATAEENPYTFKGGENDLVNNVLRGDVAAKIDVRATPNVEDLCDVENALSLSAVCDVQKDRICLESFHQADRIFNRFRDVCSQFHVVHLVGNRSITPVSVDRLRITLQFEVVYTYLSYFFDINFDGEESFKVSATSTSIAVHNLIPQTAYTARVRAFNECVGGAEH